MNRTTAFIMLALPLSWFGAIGGIVWLAMWFVEDAPNRQFRQLVCSKDLLSMEGLV
jgi:hypothetical protein